MIEVIKLKCPHCGNPNVTTETKECNLCDLPIMFKQVKDVSKFSPVDIKKYISFYEETLQKHPNNNQINDSVGICMLQLGLYDKAIEYFEKAIDNNFDNPDTYYYTCIALLKGQKAFTAPRDVINKIVEYLHAAEQLHPKGVYFYFEAYIKYDFFKRKFLNVSPNYSQLLDIANESGVSEEEIEDLFSMLKVERLSQM